MSSSKNADLRQQLHNLIEQSPAEQLPQLSHWLQT